MNHERHGRTEAGFTLVEMLVTILIMGVVTGAITTVTVSMLRNQTFQEQMTQAQDEARHVFERIRPELRSARRVEAGTSGKAELWVDDNFDGLVQDSELVTYEVRLLTSNPDRYEVVRFTAEPSSTPTRVAGVLRNPDPFDYILTPPATRAITLDFTYDVETTRGPQALHVSTTVRLRNVS